MSLVENLTILKKIKQIKEDAVRSKEKDYQEFKLALETYILDFLKENPDSDKVILHSSAADDISVIAVTINSENGVKKYIFDIPNIDPSFLTRVAREESIKVHLENSRTIEIT